MGMCELLSLGLLNFPFTGMKGKRQTEHYLQFFMVLSNIFLQPKFDFPLISFIICKYLATSTTCR